MLAPAAPEPRVQMVRALLAPQADASVEGVVAQQFADAVAAAPDDPLVLWSAATLCDGRTCDGDAALARLLAREPDNAANWLLALEAAWRRGDQATMRAALAGAARAQRHAVPFSELAQEATAVLQDMPWPRSCTATAAFATQGQQLEAAMTQGIAAASAQLGVPGRGFYALCGQGTQPGDPREADHCEAVLIRMAQDDTAMQRLTAFGLLVRVTRGRPDAARWQRRRERLAWMLQQSATLPFARADVLEMWQIGEVPALEARLRRAGRWPPPATRSSPTP